MASQQRHSRSGTFFLGKRNYDHALRLFAIDGTYKDDGSGELIDVDPGETAVFSK